ncbi:MAG TPA: hypothetical protein VIV11_11445 [Kofleriaceae bacterium]
MRSLIALLLLTASAHAGNNELTYGGTSRALRTSSANAVTGDSLVGGELRYARRLGHGFIPHLELWTHGTFAWGTADGTMFQTLGTDLDALTLALGAQVRYDLHHRITASARLDLGTTRAALVISDDMGHTARDHGWGATTAATLGLDFYAFHGARYALALRFELGAVATSSIPLTATPDTASEDTLQLEMTAASLGSLNLSGPVIAASLVGQF